MMALPIGGMSLKILQSLHNERQTVSNHQELDGLFDYLCKKASKKTSKSALRALYEGNPPVIGGFPSQRVGNTEIISIAGRHNEAFGEQFLLANMYSYSRTCAFFA